MADVEQQREKELMIEVVVEPVLNGFVVRVGCQRLVFSTIEEVAENLIAYQKDPAKVRKMFVKNAVNPTLGSGYPAPPGGGMLRPTEEREVYPR